MPSAISNTSPLFYLHQLGSLAWLPTLFEAIWTPTAVVTELRQGGAQGYAVPTLEAYPWLQIVDARAVPSEWLALDLGAGELAVLALALETPTHVLLMDERRGRRLAQAAGLTVWGTLRVLLEAKNHGLTPQIGPHLEHLAQAGMWMSPAIRQRILQLAGERAEG